MPVKKCPRRVCLRHPEGGCGCAMGNLYRFVEPLILLELARAPEASGYDLLERLAAHSLTKTTIDKAAVYRTLNLLETQGMTCCEWTPSARGAGRKAYRLTEKGRQHLGEWAAFLGALAQGLEGFIADVRAL